LISSPLFSSREISNQIRIDSPDQLFRSNPHSSEGDNGKEKRCAYQDTEGASDERIDTLNRKDTAGIAWICIDEGDKSESCKSKGQDDQTQADRYFPRLAWSFHGWEGFEGDCCLSGPEADTVPRK
jgi:hypothetical protein